MLVPVPIRFSRKCKRCGLRYPSKENECVHCYDLDDNEVKVLLLQKKKEHKTSANIGKLFLYITFLIVIGIAIVTIS